MNPSVVITRDFLKKIRRIEITTSRMVTDVFAGQYHSVFKGRGIEFDEVREYCPGDDVRTIDWNVTARTGHPYVKKYVEERELTVMLLLDVSSSSFFGSAHQLKSQLAAELCSVLAFSAIKNNDRVGLIAFSDTIEKFLPARKGPKHVLRIIRESLYQTSRKSSGLPGRKTNISSALDYLNKVTRRSAIVFLISDFYSFAKDSKTSCDFDFRKQLAIANKRHDLVALTITDPRELDLSDVGLLRLRDAETLETSMIDTSDNRVRDDYRKNSRRLHESRKQLFRSVGVDSIDIRADKPYLDEIVRFFKERQKRFR